VCLLRGTDWVFMCFVWIWEQTAIISLYSINLAGLYNEHTVYCAVGVNSMQQSLFEKVEDSQLIKKLPVLYGTQISFPYSQDPAIYHYREPD
jgi:hypothetical protein